MLSMLYLPSLKEKKSSLESFLHLIGSFVEHVHVN